MTTDWRVLVMQASFIVLMGGFLFALAVAVLLASQPTGTKNAGRVVPNGLLIDLTTGKVTWQREDGDERRDSEAAHGVGVPVSEVPADLRGDEPEGGAVRHGSVRALRVW